MRHIGAYIDLAGLDLARAQREITAQLVAIGDRRDLRVVCGVLGLPRGRGLHLGHALSGGRHCVDGRRVPGAGHRGRHLSGRASARARSPLLADVRREWQEDRVILERILSSDED